LTLARLGVAIALKTKRQPNEQAYLFNRQGIGSSNIGALLKK
jgi:hypothetical protein